MKLRDLKWLSLLSLLGPLGAILGRESLWGLGAFAAFVALFWADERGEANFRRAATTAFIVSVIGYAATFVYLGVVKGLLSSPNARIDMAGRLITAFMLTFVAQLLVFALSYIYFELRGV